ncbi:uncharacterized protein LOC129001209 [Macrosteles quadrilineatus]|uniref:uncharacterized protein LOC129001209 n=1 Tax=Macrosteles quadrilineatus TaxID=74068 RepID=UPI0023E18326|nr:uncharacterized protein LOC129001209 [Macrosteles quadrilineatus]
MEDHYSSEDEEVYFGSFAQSEITKRKHLYGDHYTSTPEQLKAEASKKLKGSLPDVLKYANTSTPVQRLLSEESGENQQTEQPQNSSVLDESDDVIIIDASVHSNSIITLSDDESFINHEKSCSNVSARSEDDNIEKNPESSNIIKLHEESISSGKHVFTCSDSDSVSNLLTNQSGSNSSTFSTTCEVSHKMETDNSVEQQSRTPYKDSFTAIANDSSTALNNSGNDSGLKNISSSNNNFDMLNSLHESAGNDSSFKSNVDCSNHSSLIQDIDDFVGTNTVENVTAVVETLVDLSVSTSVDKSQDLPLNHSTSNCQKRSSFESQDPPSEESGVFQKQTATVQSKNGDVDGERIERSFNISNMTNFSLNGITDSILHLSPGSILHSPRKSAVTRNQSFQNHFGTNNNMTDLKETIEEDLHMSVDEVDFQKQRFTENFIDSYGFTDYTNISQPSEYKSCLLSAHSSYKTAFDQTCDGNQSSSDQSNVFQNYRDVSDLDVCGDEDAVSIKSNQDNVDEAGFEMLVQARQNSFNETLVTKNVVDEKGKSKLLSKLPVYQSSKSMLRSPKLHVKPDSLKASSFKFAKQISHVNKYTSNIPKLASPKTTQSASVNKQGQTKDKTPLTKDKKIPFKTPTNISSSKLHHPTAKSIISTPKQTNSTPRPGTSLTKSRIPSHSVPSVSKTPAQTIGPNPSSKKVLLKTPVPTGIPRAVNSDSKVKRAMSPLSQHVNKIPQSTEKTLPLKNRYKNIVSPIQSYIRGSPTTLLRKAHNISDENILEGPTSGTRPVTPVKALPKAIQKLHYDAHEQENVNPNMKDYSRDTIPIKAFEPSQEIFWKQEHVESRLPVMGEKQTKILSAIPEVKLTRHEGRVIECPKSKGVLVPNNDSPTVDDLETNDLPLQQAQGRISVRVQKTVKPQ